jgi:hypothetical protein
VHYYVSNDSFISNLDLSEELNFVRPCGQEKLNLDLITHRPLYSREKPSEEWTVKSRVCQAFNALQPHSKPKKKKTNGNLNWLFRHNSRSKDSSYRKRSAESALAEPSLVPLNMKADMTSMGLK